MKKLIAIFVVIAVILSLGLSVFAADQLRTKDMTKDRLKDQTCLTTLEPTSINYLAGDRDQDFLHIRQHIYLHDGSCK
jgi:hypothetical protein